MTDTLKPLLDAANEMYERLAADGFDHGDDTPAQWEKAIVAAAFVVGNKIAGTQI